MGLKESGLRASLRNVSTGVVSIPDSVVSRPDDNNDTTFGGGKDGLTISITEPYESIQGRISSNTENQETAFLQESDGTVIDSVDISSLSPTDVFTFDDVNISAGQYDIVLDTGSNFVNGFFNGSFELPISSADGVISIESRFDQSPEETELLPRIVEVGNINL